MNTFWKIGAAIAAMSLSTAPAAAETLFGLTSGNRIVSFDSATPGTLLGNAAISGLASGEVLVGLDLRPVNRTLYTLSTAGNLYSLTGAATGYNANLIGNIGTTVSGTRFGLDFNPTVDRLRFVSDFDQNLRINPNNAVTIVDGTIDAPGAEALVGAAYANNIAAATTTTLYGIDAGGNQLLRSTNANAGTYVEVGTISGLDFGGLNNLGFDISGRTGAAYFAIGSQLYTIDLTSAAATSLGGIGGGSLIGLTAAGVPEPASWAMMIGGFGLVGGTLRRRATAAGREQLA